VSEHCRSCHEVRKRTALRKALRKAFSKKRDLDARIPQPSIEEMYGESICLECCTVSEMWTLEKEDIWPL